MEAAKSHMPLQVVLVPGLLTPALLMGLMAWRLRRAGFKVWVFGYLSRFAPPSSHGVELQRFIEAKTTGDVHLVGHSFGGIVILHRFEQLQLNSASYPSGELNHRVEASGSSTAHFAANPGCQASRTGRVVLLASPVRGSHVAREMVCRPLLGRFWRTLFGGTLERGLLGDAPKWLGLGVPGIIQGTGNRGWIARLLLSAASRQRAAALGTDGLVMQEETELGPNSCTLQLDVSHTEFLWSRKCAEQTVSYLRYGHFLDP